jgi:hypothetical protein
MSSVALLNPICRGLVGYVSYLATCDLSTVYTEYLLYEPIARIAKSHGYTVRCEVPVGTKTHRPGDLPRYDFKFTKGGRSIALELKWWRTKNSGDVTNDVKKLKASNSTERFLLIFGRSKIVSHRKAKSDGKAISRGGKPVSWDAGKTNYAARWIKV